MLIILFNEGDDAKALFFMSYGQIKLYKYTTDGKEQIINVLSDGDFFGELNILKKTKYRVNARIAYLLRSFIDKYGEKVGDNIEINLPLTREDMANYIGVARETISRKLKKLEKEGIIKIVGTKKIIILDKEFFYDYI